MSDMKRNYMKRNDIKRNYMLKLFCAIFIMSPALMLESAALPPSHAGEARDAENAGLWKFAYFEDRNLADILQLASFSNPTIWAAVEKVNQAREDVRNAAAGLGPVVSLGGTARYGRDREEYNASLNLIQTLYAGGSLTANKRAASLAFSATMAESMKTYQEVLNTVRIAYYDCLRALAQVQVASEAVTLAKEHLKQAEALHKSGMAPKGDVLRVKVSVTQGELSLVSARSDLDVNWVALEHLVGSKLARAEILKPVPSDRTEELEPPEYQTPGDVAGRALSQRAEIKAYQYYRDRAEQLIKSAKGQKLPKVTLTGRLNTDNDSNSQADDKWYVQLEAQWTLYDSDASASAIRKSKAVARELLHVLENISSQVSQEAIQAEIRLASAKTRLTLAAEQSATSKEDYQIARRRYDARLGTNLDVLDARRALLDSLTAYVNAVYDIAVAQSGLVYAMGDDFPPEELFKGGNASKSVLEDMKNAPVTISARESRDWDE